MNWAVACLCVGAVLLAVVILRLLFGPAEKERRLQEELERKRRVVDLDAERRRR